MSKTNCRGGYSRLFGTEQGGSLVELVLLTPVFCILLLGAAEFGRLMYIGIEVSNAARAGVQYGAQNSSTATDISGMQTAALNDGPDVSSLAATASHYCVCSNGSASTCANTDCSTSRILQYVQVNTTVTVSPLFTYRLPTGSVTLTGQAVQRVLQ